MENSRKHTSLDPVSIKDLCGKSFEVFTKWLPLSDSIDSETLQVFASNVLSYTPRVLFDFFDDHNILISINPSIVSNQFSWFINGGVIHVSHDRVSAEEEAFKEAFKILNLSYESAS